MIAAKFLTLFLFIAIISQGASESTLNAQRSERWDRYIQGLKDAHEMRRTRRQAGTEWHSNRANCNPAEYATRDTIGRRASGILAEPQNQGRCGSCWAFASVHALTDQLSITQGSRQPLLSAGYLTSCHKDTILIGNGNGCCGAKLHAGPEFFRDTGAVTDTCSPYNPNTRKRNLPTCPRTCSNGSPFSLSSFRTIGYQALNSEQEILAALNAESVVLAAMATTPEFKQVYQCGVYQDPDTTPERANHAVEIVDHGTTTSGTNFWVIKNSWGTTRHENGYFRIERGHLGIGMFGALQLVAGSNTQDSITTSVCAETSVSNPASNEMIMSSIEFIEQQLLTMNLISCLDGARGTGLTRESIMTADTQVITGTRVDIELIADVMGCSKTTKADINATVIIDLDGNFTLNAQSVSTRSNNGAKGFLAYWWPSLFLAALAAAFAQMLY